MTNVTSYLTYLKKYIGRCNIMMFRPTACILLLVRGNPRVLDKQNISVKSGHAFRQLYVNRSGTRLIRMLKLKRSVSSWDLCMYCKLAGQQDTLVLKLASMLKVMYAKHCAKQRDKTWINYLSLDSYASDAPELGYSLSLFYPACANT